MTCEPTRRPLVCVALLAAVVAALSFPAPGGAAVPVDLSSAGLLARGSGYGTAGGSDAVRAVQRRLRRLGNRPGPVDGLYGPLTQGAVERFQQRHGLAADGMVGRQTKRTLFSGTTRPAASPARRDTRPGTLARKSPAPNIGAESASEHPHAVPLSADAASRAGPASGTSGIPPGAIAAFAALAGVLLFLMLRKRGDVRLNLGLTCAALLGVFGIGAVAGALFATRAAPSGDGDATARSGLLLASGHSGDSRRTAVAERWARPQRVRVPIRVAAAPARRASAPAHGAPARSAPARTSPPAAPQVSVAAPAAPTVAPPVARPAPPARAAPPVRAAPPARAAPPVRTVKPRIGVQPRLQPAKRKAVPSSLGGGIRPAWSVP
jgi:hypothetical protein